MVSVLNRGGNKLDRFLEVEAKLNVSPGTTTKATLTVTAKNTVPAGENVYVAGPFPGSGVGANDYTGFLAVNVPGFAGGVKVDGFETFVAAGPDGPSQVVAVPLVLRKDETKTFTVTFELPSRGQVRVEPSGRQPAVRWSAPGQQWSDGRSRTVKWG